MMKICEKEGNYEYKCGSLDEPYSNLKKGVVQSFVLDFRLCAPSNDPYG